MTSEEDFKGYVHATAAGLFAVMAAYNLMKFASTRKPKNLVNVALYAPMAAYEVHQARDHWKRAPS